MQFKWDQAIVKIDNYRRSKIGTKASLQIIAFAENTYRERANRHGWENFFFCFDAKENKTKKIEVGKYHNFARWGSGGFEYVIDMSTGKYTTFEGWTLSMLDSMPHAKNPHEKVA